MAVASRTAVKVGVHMCFERSLSQDIIPELGMSDPRTGSLERFFLLLLLLFCFVFDMQRLCFLMAVVKSISTEHAVGSPHLPALSCICF